MKFGFMKLHQNFKFSSKLTKNTLLATPDVELLAFDLRLGEFAYNSYVGMVTFEPDSSRWISELQSVNL